MTAGRHHQGPNQELRRPGGRDRLDSQVRTGEIFALLGPNGAGKTTTVEIVEGFRQRDGGEVDVLGADPGRADRAWRNRIGIVLQSTGGLDLLTVREALRSTARAYSQPRRRGRGGRVRWPGRQGRCSHLQPQRWSAPSARRRLGHRRPAELLFLDEPTTGFDPQARRDFWELIRGLGGAGGTTILLTTHYLDEAEQLADRVGVIAAGRMLAVDTPDQLGGRDSQQATVSWEEHGQRRSLRTDHPTAQVARLGARFGGEVPGLVVSRPSLEDTYLTLIAPHVHDLQGQEVPA